MHLPRGTDINQIHVIPFTKRLPSVLTGIFRSFRPSFGKKTLLGPGYTVRLKVAQSGNLYAVDVGKSVNRSLSSHPESDESNPHRVYRITGQLQCALLTRSPWRNFHHDFPVLYAVRERTLDFGPRAGLRNGCYRYRYSKKK